jgi:hypothetical protein
VGIMQVVYQWNICLSVTDNYLEKWRLLSIICCCLIFTYVVVISGGATSTNVTYRTSLIDVSREIANPISRNNTCHDCRGNVHREINVMSRQRD